MKFCPCPCVMCIFPPYSSEIRQDHQSCSCQCWWNDGNIPGFVLPLTMNQWFLSSLSTLLTSRQPWRDTCASPFPCCCVMHAPQQCCSAPWLFEGRIWHKMNDLYLLVLACCVLSRNWPCLQKAWNATRYDWYCHLVDKNSTVLAGLG